jgi:hypothetical protein
MLLLKINFKKKYYFNIFLNKKYNYHNIKHKKKYWFAWEYFFGVERSNLSSMVSLKEVQLALPCESASCCKCNTQWI